MDTIIARIINGVIKKIESIKRNIPFSHVKKKCQTNLIYRKIRVRKLKGGKVNEDILNKRRCKSKIDKIEEITMLQETKALEEA